MEGTESSIEIRLQLSAEAADTFVERLRDDDEFRAELQSNPHETLARVGIFLSDSALPAEIELPSKEEVAALIAVSGAVQGPVLFAPCLWLSLAYAAGARAHGGTGLG